MYIYIDKKLVATINNNGTFETNITCGRHKIIIEIWSSIIEEEVDFLEDYKSVCIDVKIKMGLIAGKAEIASIRNEK